LFIERPWGGYTILHSSPEVTVKILQVNPGKRLSLQKHSHRSETWHPITEGLSAQIGRDIVLLEPGKPVTIDVGMVHRLVNGAGRQVGYVVEIIKGMYDEEDIERLEDDYGRS
jgi:mannose-1-phosphate guanylyltransferase/mannose-6-phosphate isomerase